jgi:hypothetical protein
VIRLNIVWCSGRSGTESTNDVSCQLFFVVNYTLVKRLLLHRKQMDSQSISIFLNICSPLYLLTLNYLMLSVCPFLLCEVEIWEQLGTSSLYSYRRCHHFGIVLWMCSTNSFAFYFCFPAYQVYIKAETKLSFVIVWSLPEAYLGYLVIISLPFESPRINNFESPRIKHFT